MRTGADDVPAARGLSALARPELVEALAFARSQPRPVTADELAEATRVHRNVARSRLERLAEGGLLTVAHERRTGRAGPGAGRPARIYGVPPELEAIEFPRHRYELLVARLLDELPARGRAARLRRIGADFGRELAAQGGLDPAPSVAVGLERACAAVGSLGFQAAVVEASDEHGEISTPTCPLRPLVADHPEAADLDRGMWSGLVSAAVAGVEATEVSCETSGCADGHASCRVLLSLRARAEG